MREPPKNESILIRCLPELRQDLQAVADQRGIKLAEVVREALEAFLKGGHNA